MLPINKLDKFIFVCLYNFANSLRLYIYIIAIYTVTNMYFGVNDGKIVIYFVLALFISVPVVIEINDKFKKEFTRYKKYLTIKRIRSHKGQ